MHRTTAIALTVSLLTAGALVGCDEGAKTERSTTTTDSNGNTVHKETTTTQTPSAPATVKHEETTTTTH